ncbi:hypothetical protein HAX54_048484 [Datura stramonium]|uniref:Uncharacterized protein n=1 Tax=Datura stramonium TaxID=4076 RepID=A0ABS8RQI6_DATST|nr:hypothetical protein [Datura stramonium]
MKQIELLVKCMMGFHSRYQQANQGYWYLCDENQGWKSDCTSESRKDHEVSIEHVEDRVNLLEYQIKSRESMMTQEIVKEDATTISRNADEEEIEWGMEESIFQGDARRHSLEYGW